MACKVARRSLCGIATVILGLYLYIMSRKEHLMQTQLIYHSPLGNIRLTAEDNALTEAAFDVPATLPQSPTPFLESVCRCLDTYFNGKAPETTPLLRPAGTPFQLRIWRLAQQIPFGCTATYGMLAQEAAREMGIPKMSAQAVGGAMKRNPIAIFIPCHRVVGANGKLGGYFGNDRRKIDLLTLEGQDMRGFRF